MMKFSYPAVFKKNKNGSFDVSFPDIGGCTVNGADYESALAEAKDALRSWLEVIVLEDMELPPFVSEPDDIATGAGEKVQLVAVNLRFMEGWDE